MYSKRLHGCLLSSINRDYIITSPLSACNGACLLLFVATSTISFGGQVKRYRVKSMTLLLPVARVRCGVRQPDAGTFCTCKRNCICPLIAPLELIASGSGNWGLTFGTV